jgi:hypothetical protein
MARSRGQDSRPPSPLPFRRWQGRSTEAAIRRKIRGLLRKHEYRSTTFAGSDAARDLNHYTQLVLDEAKSLYRYYPETEDRLFE